MFKTEAQAEFAQALSDVVKRKARNAGEWLSFDVRPGVTFQGLEVFYLNRIVQVSDEKLARLLAADGLGRYVVHLFHNNLRGKTLIPWNPHQYRRQDVLREVVFSYRRLLEHAVGAEKAAAVVEELEHEIRRWAAEDIPDVALYTQLVGRLERELPRILASIPEPVVEPAVEPEAKEEAPAQKKRGPGRPRKEAVSG